jgi:hypothetical protein
MSRGRGAIVWTHVSPRSELTVEVMTSRALSGHAIHRGLPGAQVER